MTSAPAPALLTAALGRIRSDRTYQSLVTAGYLAADALAVTTNPLTGLPYSYPATAVVLWHAGSWHRNDTTARFPRLGVSVYASDEASSPQGEWTARYVAQALAELLDDPAHAKPSTWTDVNGSVSLRILSCRWDGSLIAAPVEGQDGSYRADAMFEIEIG